MPWPLATYETYIQNLLADASAAIWSVAWIDDALRQALKEYSTVLPIEQAGTVTLASSGREISLATLTNLANVQAVWLPYTAADPEDPPNSRHFRFWPDLNKAYILGGPEPDSGDVARVFYTKPHTINALDSATTTTVPANDEHLLVRGAAGLCAMTRALDLTEQVTLDRTTPTMVLTWGKDMYRNFQDTLRHIAISRQGQSLVQLPLLDRHDGDWQ
jgi:hypothetical protein